MKINSMRELQCTLESFTETDNETLANIMEYVQTLQHELAKAKGFTVQRDYEKDFAQLQQRMDCQIKDLTDINDSLERDIQTQNAEINLWKEKWKVVEMFLQK